MRVASSFPHWNPHRNYPRCSVNVSRVRFKRIVLTMTLATTKVITAHRYTPSINAFLYSDSCPALHGLQLHAPGAPLLPIVTFLPSSPRRQRENQSARTTRRGDGPTVEKSTSCNTSIVSTLRCSLNCSVRSWASAETLTQANSGGGGGDTVQEPRNVGLLFSMSSILSRGTVFAQ